MITKTNSYDSFENLDVTNDDAVINFFEGLPADKVVECLIKLEQKRLRSRVSDAVVAEREEKRDMPLNREIKEKIIPQPPKTDPRAARNSGVLAGAFRRFEVSDAMKADEEKAFEDFLYKLYRTEPVYEWGTESEPGRENLFSVGLFGLNVFSAQVGKTPRQKFTDQMDILTGRLFDRSSTSVMGGYYRYEKEYGSKITGEPEVVRYRIDFYYRSIKQKLEHILFFCRHKEVMTNDMTKLILSELEDGLSNCPPGITGHVSHALNRLIMGRVPGLTPWLAELRKGILDQWVTGKIDRQGRSFEVHFFTAAYQVAVEKGWNIPGADDMANIADDYAYHNDVSSDFERYFRARFTQDEIISYIAGRYEMALRDIFPAGERYFSYTIDLPNVLGSVFSYHPKYNLNFFLDMDRVKEQRWFLRKIDFRAIAEDLLVEQGVVMPCPAVSAGEASRIDQALRMLHNERACYAPRTPNADASKYHLVDDVIDRIDLIKSDQSGRKVERIASVIQDELLTGERYELKDRHWAEKLGRMLLNILMIVPGLGIPAYVKYVKTGSAFFSLAPREVYRESFHQQVVNARLLVMGRG